MKNVRSSNAGRGAAVRDDNTDMDERGSNCGVRWGLVALGWLNVALGVIGAFVPGMPTTVFLIIAAWAFSKSSRRFHLWLWNHRKLGPAIRGWHEHRAIPMRAKVIALSTMTINFTAVSYFVADSWVLPTIMAAVMLPAMYYIASRKTLRPVAVASTSSQSYSGSGQDGVLAR